MRSSRGQQLLYKFGLVVLGDPASVGCTTKYKRGREQGMLNKPSAVSTPLAFPDCELPQYNLSYIRPVASDACRDWTAAIWYSCGIKRR